MRNHGAFKLFAALLTAVLLVGPACDDKPNRSESSKSSEDGGKPGSGLGDIGKAVAGGGDIRPQTGDAILDALFTRPVLARTYSSGAHELCFDPNGKGRMVLVDFDDEGRPRGRSTLWDFAWELEWSKGELYASSMDDVRLVLSRNRPFKQRDGSVQNVAVKASYRLNVEFEGMQTAHTDQDDFMSVAWRAAGPNATGQAEFFEPDMSLFGNLRNRLAATRQYVTAIDGLNKAKRVAFVKKHCTAMMNMTYTVPNTDQFLPDGKKSWDALRLMTTPDGVSASYSTSAYGMRYTGELQSARLDDGGLLVLDFSVTTRVGGYQGMRMQVRNPTGFSFGLVGANAVWNAERFTLAAPPPPR